MTEKECLKALDCLYDDDVFDKEVWGFVREGDNLSCADVEIAKKYYRDKIYNLIKEHFDNPPLKFEELKKSMWVWVKKLNGYFRINGIVNLTKENGKKYVDFGFGYIEFKDNMFYRKQVEE